MTPDDHAFALEDLNTEIHNPACGHEIVHDQEGLPLAVSRTRALLECENCALISERTMSGHLPTTEQVTVKPGHGLKPAQLASKLLHGLGIFLGVVTLSGIVSRGLYYGSVDLEPDTLIYIIQFALPASLIALFPGPIFLLVRSRAQYRAGLACWLLLSIFLQWFAYWNFSCCTS